MRLAKAALLSLILAPPAQADITRGCSAQWVVRAGPSERVVASFDSRGRCRNRIHANDCRRAARDAAMACFRDHWARRWDDRIRAGTALPPNCVGRGDTGVRGYRVGDIKRALEQQACGFGAPPFPVTVIGRTRGDTGCGGEVALTGTYVIKDEMCGKR